MSVDKNPPKAPPQVWISGTSPHRGSGSGIRTLPTRRPQKAPLKDHCSKARMGRPLSTTQVKPVKEALLLLTPRVDREAGTQQGQKRVKKIEKIKKGLKKKQQH